MSPSGPTPPGTRVPSLTATHGDEASGYVKFTGAPTFICAAPPIALRGYGSVVRLVSAVAACAVPVTAAAPPTAVAPVILRKMRRLTPLFGACPIAPPWLIERMGCFCPRKGHADASQQEPTSCA